MLLFSPLCFPPAAFFLPFVNTGGYAAEEAINGKENVSTGPMSDLQQATSLARRMVANHGFSDKVGAVQYDLQNDVIAPETRLIIDQEVRRLCDKALEDARMILKRHDREHHRLAEALLEYKTLTQEVRAPRAGVSVRGPLSRRVGALLPLTRLLGKYTRPCAPFVHC